MGDIFPKGLWIIFSPNGGFLPTYPQNRTSLHPLISAALGITFSFYSQNDYAIILLTRREDLDMTDILIHKAGNHQVTCVPNAFIDEYMQEANGEFVKIYLYLLRMLNPHILFLFSLFQN